MVDKLKWCLKQKKGIELINPKSNLSKAYLMEADETLENVSVVKGKWKIITAYYACYNALYAILMKCGIKCEIHDCTIELMRLFNFTQLDIEYMRELKDTRIKAQYYLKKVFLKEESKVKQFISKCKIILSGLSSSDIIVIRRQLNDKSN